MGTIVPYTLHVYMTMLGTLGTNKLFVGNTRLNILGTISFYVYVHFGTIKCNVLR